MVIFDNIIHRMRFPKFLKIVEERLNSQCEVLLEAIFQHGRLTFEQLSQHSLSKDKAIDLHALKESFNRLVKGRYIERCPKPEPFLSSSAEDAPPPRKRNQKFVLDTMTMEKKALANATLSDAERFCEITNFECDNDTLEDKFIEGKRKYGSHEIDKKTEATIVEKEVLWRANFQNFINFLRAKACISYKSSRLTNDAGVILEALIECCSNQSTEMEASFDEIFGHIANHQAHMTKDYVGQVLDEIGCQQSMKGIVAFYTIDLKSIIEDSRKEEMETIILQRYGKSACKIFRLLSTKNQPFETDKISDMTFVDKKEAIALFYKLWNDKILHMEPVGSTDQKKGYYLWKISESASSDFFLENIYHTAANLNQRIDYHYEENKEFILLSAEDKKEMIKNQPERCKVYQHYVKTVKILETSLLNLDKLLLYFHDF